LPTNDESAINTDADQFTTGDADIDTASLSFLKKYAAHEDAEKSSDDSETDDKQTPPPKKEEPAESDESPDEADETDEGEEDAKPQRTFVEDNDDTYVKVKVGDKEHEVTVKDLKRLWGQESALTTRSQEVAQQRQRAEAETQKAVAVLNKMVEAARERARPFENFNFLVAAKELSTEELQQISNAAQAAFNEKKFMESELDTFMKGIADQQLEHKKAAAQEAVKALTDQASPYHVDGWGDKLYGDLREFGVKSGISKDVMNSLTDAPIFKLLHQAMLYQRGSKQVETKVVNKQPKKIVKTSKTPEVRKNATADDKVKSLQSKLRKSGSTDDAADLFLARWSAAED
jgi:hypothetical protein